MSTTTQETLLVQLCVDILTHPRDPAGYGAVADLLEELEDERAAQFRKFWEAWTDVKEEGWVRAEAWCVLHQIYVKQIHKELTS